MPSRNADGEPRPALWLRVREFAVPPSMIESATARRAEHDWAAACAAAGVDVELNLRVLARARGADLTARVRADLRKLAPDLLRWHLPRIAPDGLLRPDLTLSLARYDGGDLHLVARTPPGWAAEGQRFSLALWDRAAPGSRRPDRRFRLDLHRHLWDATRAGELRDRSMVDEHERWAAEAAVLLRSEGLTEGALTVRAGSGRRLLLELDRAGTLTVTPRPVRGWATALPVLPDAATWEVPDLALLRAGLIAPGRLHPLVAAALAPGHPWTGTPPPPTGPRVVLCGGAEHRIDLVDGTPVPLDHSPDEIRREELLAALSGTPLPCLRALADDSDDAGEIEPAALRQLTHGLFRAGLLRRGPVSICREQRNQHRGHPRLAAAR